MMTPRSVTARVAWHRARHHRGIGSRVKSIVRSHAASVRCDSARASSGQLREYDEE
ncbi:hypothetical protein [Cupriavidus agavae]|uniref:hypothetical protein n=1 Tax=Cupriavidus agavae TaxID=1001822 RepID=UPI0013008A36|nr:hypothetical protein [Cupriavidus agavae]